MTNNKEKVFLLGGKDAEMVQIKRLLDQNNVHYIDKGLGWGAKVEDYADEIKQLIAEGKQPVAIELTGAGEGEYADVMSIDHHGERAGEQAAILQVIEEVQKYIKDMLQDTSSDDISTPEVIDEKGMMSIKGLATALGMTEEKVTLPNGKEIMSLVWKPEHLPAVFDLINISEAKKLLGKNDVVTIDGVCPTRLLPTISHALHPVSTAVSYPQGGLDAKLPLSGCSMEHEGHAEGVKFEKIEDEEKTSISFELTSPSIDVMKAMESLVAPEVTKGKPVFISGRGPIAIATALAEAYAHRVPFVACFQPGTGRVVCISHSDVALGTIFA